MRLRGILFLGAAAIIISLGVSTAKAHSESEEAYENTASHTAAMPIMLVDGTSENPAPPLITMIAAGSVVATLLAFRLMHKKK